MKTILYMSITANGLIAKENDDTSWVSPTEWKSFCRMVQKAGNMIIGRKTYEVMIKNNEFKRLGDVKAVVISRTLKIDQGRAVVKSPGEALTFLQQQGFSTALVCGGGKLNSSFMKEKLIDEIYLDLEPIILGKGINLVNDVEFEAKLQLIGIKKMSRDEVQLHYRVKR